jgi:hypothetical protein
MCKAYKAGSNIVLGSGEAPNERESSSRFEYYAEQYDEKLRTDCQRFTTIDPEYRKSFEPGETYTGSMGDVFTIEHAPFLPENWSTTPTPKEKGRKSKSDRTETKSTAKSEHEVSTPPKKSAAQVAAEEAAARKAQREAEFQAKQDEYERQMADRERKLQEFNELTAKMEAQKLANAAAAEAAASAYKQEQDKYAAALRQHQDEVSRYQAQVNGTTTTSGRFQVTGAIVDTREAAMAALMRDPRGPRITDVQCGEVKMFTPAKWTCWGFVTETIEAQQGSKQ